MRMLRLLVFSCVAALATPATARVTFQFSGALNLGWTDNVLNTPLARSGAPFPQSPAIADFFGDIRPSLVLTTSSSRVIQALIYTFSYTYFFRNSSANAYSNTLSWSGAFLPSKRTDLLLTVLAAQTEQTTAGFATDPSQPTLLLPGRINTASVSLREQLGIDAAQRLRVLQLLAFSGTIPISPRTLAPNLSADLGATVDYRWRKAALGLVLNVNYFYAFEVRGAGPIQGDGSIDPNALLTRDQGFFTNSLIARWRQDFGHFWSSELGLGVLHTITQQGSGSRFGPAANAALRYLRPEAALSLTYAHTTQPSPLLAQLFLSDTVALTASTPLGIESRITLTTTASYSYSRQLLTDGGQGAAGHLVTADVSLNYMPIVGLSIYLRGQTSYQRGLDDTPTPLPTVRRDVILVGISGFYPATAAAIVPRRQGTRVDGSDRVTIPEPHRRDGN